MRFLINTNLTSLKATYKENKGSLANNPTGQNRYTKIEGSGLQLKTIMKNEKNAEC